MGATIMESILVTRSQYSTLFREISREILWFVCWPNGHLREISWNFAQNVMAEHSRKPD